MSASLRSVEDAVRAVDSQRLVHGQPTPPAIEIVIASWRIPFTGLTDAALPLAAWVGLTFLFFRQVHAYRLYLNEMASEQNGIDFDRTKTWPPSPR